MAKKTQRGQRPLTTAARVSGCLLGGAIGDALGAPVEFMSLADIRQRFGPDGVTQFEEAYGRRGAITDDTQMTLFTAEGLIRADVRSAERGICSPAAVIHHAYDRWLVTQGEASAIDCSEPDGWLIRQRELWARRAPGATCLEALQRAEHFGSDAQNMSKGCGALMRVAPVGLVYPAVSDTGRFPAYELGNEVAMVTHGHPTGFLAAGYFAELIALLVEGRDLLVAIGQATLPLEMEHCADDILAAIDRATRLAKQGPPSAERLQTLGRGWTADEALAIALYCALVARDFDHGVLLAVNHDGDSDSTGALVGSLLGAMLGAAAIPKRWQRSLELGDVIQNLASDLTATRMGRLDCRQAWAKYPGW